MTEYDISKSAGRCSATGRVLAEGESFYSAVFETPRGFERKDYCHEAWSGPPEGALCHFRARVPKRSEPKRTFVDDQALLDFFLRLAGQSEPAKQQFRFVLALILLRKRVLKYERTLREEEAEVWELRLVRDKTLHRVTHPALDQKKIGALTRELNAILSADLLAAIDAEPTGVACQGAAQPAEAP